MMQQRNINKWKRAVLPIFTGVFIIGLTFFVLWSNAQAGFRTGGAGNCGNFDEAIAVAEDGDVVVQMVEARNSGSPVITKNLRISGGWQPPGLCDEINQYFTDTIDLLNFGFQYQAPDTRSELFSNGGPIFNLAERANQQLIIEHFILANSFNIPTYGAGINGTISSTSHVLLDNLLFRDNYVGTNGGGIHLAVAGGSQLLIEDSAFYTNTADNYGGAISAELRHGSRVNIENTVVISNQALFGGGVNFVVYEPSHLTISNTQFVANSTTSVNGYGGGAQIFTYGGQVTLDGVIFEGNEAGNDGGGGGGLYMRMDGGHLVIKDSLFRNNSAGDAGAGGLYIEGVGIEPATVQIINTRFEGNLPDAYYFTGNLQVSMLDHSVYLPLIGDPSVQTARINEITLGEDFNFIVDFETFNFTPADPGVHVHFFFDTVSPEDAGVPSPEPWLMYAGPSPFTGYNFADRPFGPDGAEKMCIIVANSNHTVRPGTGNCFKLP